MMKLLSRFAATSPATKSDQDDERYDCVLDAYGEASGAVGLSQAIFAATKHTSSNIDEATEDPGCLINENRNRGLVP
jgi:hypothetical protein